ncbi:uncharacterized protein LOC100382453 [Zea mays]|uniref:BHLH domain-containing protein n=1 Tax=Zea mays TaxID=4577 RepID=C0P7Y0_MAIZE|nr:uncharacterized protein LOC100382453 [Zea mays]ACN29096.1 unknown [Zea mays]|eukprot:NP_001168665.1 putative HLH DNA-binding domain superfamily protein [Zea mays]
MCAWCRSDSNDFVELLWENGQAVVHGRRKQHPQAAFPPFTCGAASSSRAQENQPGTTDPVSLFKTGGLFADFSSGLDAARGNGDLDDTVPWIHCPIVEEDSAAPAPALAEGYSPDFFSELHAAALAAAAAETNLSPLPPPVQHNRSTPVATTSRGPEPSKEAPRIPVPGPGSRPEPQSEFAATRKPRPESGGEGLMNFSLFSRPAALVRASLQRPPPPQTGTDKVSNVTTSTRVESTVLQSASGPRIAPVFTDQRTAWSQSKEVRFSCAPALAAGNLHQDMPLGRPGNNMTPQGKMETKKACEVAVATPSLCSGNGESWREQKRKSQAECSASQDDDLDDESGGMRGSGGRGTKRSRTAEVHNLSERRRRDRINEKMRALQELIPNCNKVRRSISTIF